MGNQEMVPIKIFTLYYQEIITVVHIYCQSKPDFALKILQRLLNFLPKVSLTLKFKSQNVESFRRTMESVEGVNEIKEIDFGYFFWHPDQVPHDELVKLILEKSQRAKSLRVTVSTSDKFEYPTSGVPFKFDSVSMACTDWISRDHFIELFLSCKKVELHWKDFDDEDLAAIFRAWTEGSALKFLRFTGTDNFYQRKTLDNILKEHPGAAPVKNALIQTEVFTRSHVETFGEGKCFLIQRNDAQTTALVCILTQSIILTTDFKIGKEVDEMVARIEEERLIRQHPVDQNMEEEDDD
ncbi:unnamed protein product [Caenorhabditis brenneri]